MNEQGFNLGNPNFNNYQMNNYPQGFNQGNPFFNNYQMNNYQQGFNQGNPFFNNYQMNQNQMNDFNDSQMNMSQNQNETNNKEDFKDFRNERFLEYYNIIKNHNIEFDSNKYKNKLIINYCDKIRKLI